MFRYLRVAILAITTWKWSCNHGHRKSKHASQPTGCVHTTHGRRSVRRNIARRTLFGKLNTELFRAIESATAFAKLRGNPYVEMVHWLHQVWQAPGGDLHRIATHYRLDPAQLEKDLTLALAQLPSGASSINDFIPVRLGFAGLFDCVASVRIADSARRVAPFAGVMDGHFA